MELLNNLKKHKEKSLIIKKIKKYCHEKQLNFKKVTKNDPKLKLVLFSFAFTYEYLLKKIPSKEILNNLINNQFIGSFLTLINFQLPSNLNQNKINYDVQQPSFLNILDYSNILKIANNINILTQYVVEYINNKKSQINSNTIEHIFFLTTIYLLSNYQTLKFSKKANTNLHKNYDEKVSCGL